MKKISGFAVNSKKIRSRFNTQVFSLITKKVNFTENSTVTPTQAEILAAPITSITLDDENKFVNIRAKVGTHVYDYNIVRGVMYCTAMGV